MVAFSSSHLYLVGILNPRAAWWLINHSSSLEKMDDKAATYSIFSPWQNRSSGRSEGGYAAKSLRQLN
jgi:hypothetical protein